MLNIHTTCKLIYFSKAMIKINGFRQVIHYIPESGTYFSNVDARTSEQIVDTFNLSALSLFKIQYPSVQLSLIFFLFLENSWGLFILQILDAFADWALLHLET